MDRSEKLKLVVIGKHKKHEKPRCLQRVNRSNLPAYYWHNLSAWMNNTNFQEWLNKINSKFKPENRMMLLLMDNFSEHKIETYSNLKLHFSQLIRHLYLMTHILTQNCVFWLEIFHFFNSPSFNMGFLIIPNSIIRIRVLDFRTVRIIAIALYEIWTIKSEKNLRTKDS